MQKHIYVDSYISHFICDRQGISTHGEFKVKGQEKIKTVRTSPVNGKEGLLQGLKRLMFVLNGLHPIHHRQSLLQMECSWANIRVPPWFTPRTEGNCWWSLLTSWAIAASSSFISTTMLLRQTHCSKRQNVISGRNDQKINKKNTAHGITKTDWPLNPTTTLNGIWDVNTYWEN